MTGWHTKAPVHKKRDQPVYLKSIEIPSVPNDRILVKTEYASINPIDIKLHSLSFLGFESHTIKDYAGTIEAVGSNYKGKFTVGQKVWGSIPRPGTGSYVGSLTVVNPETDVIAPLPGKLSTREAASIGVVYGTAYQMLEYVETNHKLGPDSKILILGGATSVGSYIAQLAKKYHKVGTVVATSSPSSADYVKSFGVDEVINYRSENLSGDFQKYVKNSGAKFDAILDAVGGYDALRVWPDILKPANEGSAYVTIIGDSGPSSSYATTMLKTFLCAPRVLTRYFLGRWLGINYRLLLLTNGKWVDAASEVFSIPGFKVPIDSTYSVSELKQAWQKVDSTRARGKVVIQF